MVSVAIAVAFALIFFGLDHLGVDHRPASPSLYITVSLWVATVSL